MTPRFSPGRRSSLSSHLAGASARPFFSAPGSTTPWLVFALFASRDTDLPATRSGPRALTLFLSHVSLGKGANFLRKDAKNADR